MEVPDKIFVREYPDGICRVWEEKRRDDVVATILHEYIRKDALLEWLQPRANELKQRWMANPADTEAFHKQLVFSSIIDKLNSM